MTIGNRVIVKRLPERVVLGEVDEIARELGPVLRADRPLIVLDFSDVQQLDSSGIEMLLRCLEEVMRRNGDLKLADVPPAAGVVLELTGVDRFFEIYENASEAVESFFGLPARALQQVRPSWREAVQGPEDEPEFKLAS
jgi:anti-sigma B factor antagonist